MNKGTKWTIGILIAMIIILVIIFAIYLCNDQRKVETKEPVAVSAVQKVSNDSQSKADSLELVLKIYKEIVKNNCIAKNTVTQTKGSSKKKVVNTSKGQKNKVTDANELVTDDNFKVETVSTTSSSSRKMTSSSSSEISYETSLGASQYVGKTDGDFYATISEDNHLQYCFAKRLYDEAGGTGVPELNYKGSGKFFELVGDTYIYVDKSIVINANVLSRSWGWAVFIGVKPGDGYDMYLPHEIIKPSIAQVKGSLAGTISPQDLSQIGELVSEVGLGRIEPNKVTAADNADPTVYEGWRFKTPVLYAQK